MSNLSEISPIYLKHFIKCIDERYVVLQGSRRSGKSWAVHRFLKFLASGKDRFDILIACYSFPALKNTIKDFQSATGCIVEGSQINGFHYQLPNGSIIYFNSFDEYTKCQGVTADFLYLEEALNFSEDIVSTLSLGIRRQIYFAYNPTRKSYIDKYINDKNFLLTTYKNNPHLPPHQIYEFEEIERRAKSPTASILDVYQYNVYVLGRFSDVGGKVFKELFKCTKDEFDKIDAPIMRGLDFGFVDGNDKTALVEIKIHNNVLYINELLYSNQLSKDIDLARTLVDLNILYSDPIAADYGGMGKTRIQNLITANDYEWTEEPINKGFTIFNANKGKVIDGITKILNYDRIILTENSVNLRQEMEGYELTENLKPKGDDHLIDAVRYAVNSYNRYFY